MRALNLEEQLKHVRTETTDGIRKSAKQEATSLALDAVRREAVKTKSKEVWTPFPPTTHPLAVDCNSVLIATPIRAFGMTSLGPKYMVLYSWWNTRRESYQKTYEQMRLGEANDSVENVQKLIFASPPGAAFLDISADAGCIMCDVND